MFSHQLIVRQRQEKREKEDPVNLEGGPGGTKKIPNKNQSSTKRTFCTDKKPVELWLVDQNLLSHDRTTRGLAATANPTKNFKLFPSRTRRRIKVRIKTRGSPLSFQGRMVEPGEGEAGGNPPRTPFPCRETQQRIHYYLPHDVIES